MIHDFCIKVSFIVIKCVRLGVVDIQFLFVEEEQEQNWAWLVGMGFRKKSRKGKKGVFITHLVKKAIKTSADIRGK